VSKKKDFITTKSKTMLVSPFNFLLSLPFFLNCETVMQKVHLFKRLLDKNF